MTTGDISYTSIGIIAWISNYTHVKQWDMITHLWPNLSGCLVNTLRPRQNGRHFPDNIFKWIFLSENVWISINFSLKFVPRGPINNIPTLVQVMAWRRPGDKPLSEPMMVRLPTHICVTRPQWVKLLQKYATSAIEETNIGKSWCAYVVSQTLEVEVDKHDKSSFVNFYMPVKCERDIYQVNIQCSDYHAIQSTRPVSNPWG